MYTIKNTQDDTTKNFKTEESLTKYLSKNLMKLPLFEVFDEKEQFTLDEVFAMMGAPKVTKVKAKFV